MQISFLGHTKSQTKEEHSKTNKRKLTIATSLTEVPSQSPTTKDSVKVLKILEKSMASKYILKVEGQ